MQNKQKQTITPESNKQQTQPINNKTSIAATTPVLKHKQLQTYNNDINSTNKITNNKQTKTSMLNTK